MAKRARHVPVYWFMILGHQWASDGVLLARADLEPHFPAGASWVELWAGDAQRLLEQSVYCTWRDANPSTILIDPRFAPLVCAGDRWEVTRLSQPVTGQPLSPKALLVFLRGEVVALICEHFGKQLKDGPGITVGEILTSARGPGPISMSCSA